MPQKVKKKNSTNSKRGDATKAQLEKAALEMMRDNGVLAGVNLREVAEKAGINRALVYHYFGTREDLLRSALSRDLGARLDSMNEGISLPFNPRVRQLFRNMVQYEAEVKLLMLLLIDDNEPLTLAPQKKEWVEALARDKEKGLLDKELDVTAFIVLISVLTYGYAIMRDSFADELEINPVELDWRLDTLIEKLVSVFEPKQ